MNTIKSKACGSGAIAIHGVGVLGAMLLTGCAALPAVPTRPMLYDFGPASVAPAPAGRRAALPALVLVDVEAPGLPDGSSAVLYPLPSPAWPMPPPDNCPPTAMPAGASRPPNCCSSNCASRSAGAAPSSRPTTALPTPPPPPPTPLPRPLLNSPTQSAGVVRLRATMVERTPTGESLRGQRVFIMQKPARSTDAAGGVAALAEASTPLASELAEWGEQGEATPH